MDNGNEMKFFRQLSVNIFRVWHPAFFMAGLHLALYFASHNSPSQPIMEFIRSKIAIVLIADVLAAPVAWQIMFLSSMFLLLKFDDIGLVVFFSLPAMIYGWFVTWYGLSTHSTPLAVAVFVLVAWVAVLGVVIMTKVVAGLFEERHYLALKIADMEEKLRAYEVAASHD